MTAGVPPRGAGNAGYIIENETNEVTSVYDMAKAADGRAVVVRRKI